MPDSSSVGQTDSELTRQFQWQYHMIFGFCFFYNKQLLGSTVIGMKRKHFKQFSNICGVIRICNRLTDLFTSRELTKVGLQKHLLVLKRIETIYSGSHFGHWESVLKKKLKSMP
jgi:hypothetical protein